MIGTADEATINARVQFSGGSCKTFNGTASGDTVNGNYSCSSQLGSDTGTWFAVRGGSPPIIRDIDFGPAFGAPQNQTQLTTQLQYLGVTFSSTGPNGVVWYGQNPSPGNFQYVISGGFSSAGLGVIDPIRVDFGSIVERVSIRGFDGGGDVDTMILRCFSSSGKLVDMATLSSTFGGAGHTLSVSGTEIAYATFEVQGTASGLFFDDLTFTVK